MWSWVRQQDGDQRKPSPFGDIAGYRSHCYHAWQKPELHKNAQIRALIDPLGDVSHDEHLRLVSTGAFRCSCTYIDGRPDLRWYTQQVRIESIET